MSGFPDFVKYHALGNDYIVVDPRHTHLCPESASVRLICDRHTGVGADGLLFGPTAPVLPGRPIELRIFNSDGSECERSGNGIRIFALYLAERHEVADRFVIRTTSGDTPVHIEDLAEGVVRMNMGHPTFDAAAIPVCGTEGPVMGQPLAVDGRVLSMTCVNLGNPHTVVNLPNVTPGLARALGPQIARHARFPSGTNVQFLRVIDRATIEIEIFERGAGYTLSSGSSGCAAASAAHGLDLVDEDVDVLMPGGSLRISFAADGSLMMTGTAEQVTTGMLASAFRRRLGMGG